MNTERTPNEHSWERSNVRPNVFATIRRSTHGKRVNFCLHSIRKKRPSERKSFDDSLKIPTDEGMLANANEGIRCRLFADAVPSTYQKKVRTKAFVRCLFAMCVRALRRTYCCTLFVVRHQFSCGRRFFFDKKILCGRQRDCYPNANPAYSVRRKTCLRNMANTFYTLFAARHFFVVSPLFRCCSQIVYSGFYSVQP